MSTKILVMSDTHGALSTVRNIIDANDDADIIFFLGDGAVDIKLATMHLQKQVAKVKGNCDGYSSEELAPELVLDIDGYKMMLTHGHLYNVKSSYELYAATAKKRGCHAALFGHTHRPENGECWGVRLFNPGSVLNGSYGIIKIAQRGIEYKIMNICDG